MNNNYEPGSLHLGLDTSLFEVKDENGNDISLSSFSN